MELRRPPILAALLVSILLQLIPFMYVQAQSKPEWAAKGVYLTYSWELWEYCPVEEVNSKIEEMKGRISELFKFILIQVDDEKGIFTITVGEKSTNDEFFWEDAHWKTLEAFPLYYPSAKLQNAPIVQLSMALGTYRVYKLTKEPEEYAMGPTLYFHEELHILLLGVSLSKAKPDPFTGKLSQDVSVVQLVDTNIPIGGYTDKWSVGVNVGDWAVYDFTFSSNNPNYQSSQIMNVASTKIIVQKVLGTYVNFIETWYLKNGTEYFSRKVEIDVKTWEFEEEITISDGKPTSISYKGRTTPLIIAANMKRGDKIFDYAPVTFDATERIRITDTIVRTYAGASREINYLHCLGFYPHDPEEAVAGFEGRYYWDRASGILTEMYFNVTTQTGSTKIFAEYHIRIRETNVWAVSAASDLTIIYLSASPLKTSRLGTLTVSFTEKNQGSINSGTFVTRIYLGKTERALDYLIGETEMHSLKAGETRIFNLELRIPNTVPSGSYRVVVYADYFNELGEANEENNIVSTSDKVTIALYELFIEIDYMLGHRPTQSVLNYIEDYFLQRDVLVTFHVDDEVPLDLEVTREELFSFEMQYNDMGDDKIVYNWWGREYKFTSKWKWVLFGTMDAEDGANGYTYCAHDDGGNYIFISDESNDELAFMLRNGNITPEKVETVVLMHELGHSIGILRIDENGDQVYDSDWWSVMARLSPINCNANPIRYSQEYWALRNMESYIIT